MKLPEPAIFQEQWDYNSYGEISSRAADIVGYTQKQVEEIVTDFTVLLSAARDVFDQLSKLGNGDMDGNSIGNTIAQEARAKIDKVLENENQNQNT